MSEFDSDNETEYTEISASKELLHKRRIKAQYPSDNDTGILSKLDKLRIKRGIIWRLLQMAGLDWVWLLLGFAFLLIAAYTQALLPRLTGYVINDVVIDRSQENFRRTLSQLVLVSVITSVASGLRGSCFLVAMARLNVRIRDRAYRAILRQEIAFFDDNKTGPPPAKHTSRAEQGMGLLWAPARQHRTSD